jgi:hypothetical protein
MKATKAMLPASLLVVAMWCQSGAASADDANATANAQRIHATITAQSMLGYPAVAPSDQSGCCCPDATASGYTSANLQQQIATLSAALRQAPEPPKLSPAQLAEGAY